MAINSLGDFHVFARSGRGAATISSASYYKSTADAIMGETWKKVDRDVNPCAFKRDRQLIYIHMCHKIETSRREKRAQT